MAEHRGQPITVVEVGAHLGGSQWSCCFLFRWTLQGWSTCIEVCKFSHPSIHPSIHPSTDQRALLMPSSAFLLPQIRGHAEAVSCASRLHFARTYPFAPRVLASVFYLHLGKVSHAWSISKTAPGLFWWVLVMGQHQDGHSIIFPPEVPGIRLFNLFGECYISLNLIFEIPVVSRIYPSKSPWNPSLWCLFHPISTN